MNSWASVEIPPISERFSLPELSLWDTARMGSFPLEKKSLYRLYVCGITPYDATHLGHAATYLTFDLVNRYLRATGADVRFVQNITDIDDPLLERALRDGVDWKSLAHSQIELFCGDMVNLHILPPAHYIGVIEAMDLISGSISALENMGLTYRVEDDLYLSIHADPKFGSRSHLSQGEMLEVFQERGGDPARIGKRDPLDALLWLGRREGEPSWSSPQGEGRPGWHIECSAIALHYLAPDEESTTAIDIQGGGNDLIFPHHEMSAAQAKMLTGKEFASHYVHAGMIALDGVKMSKSLGNLVFVSKLVESGVDPMAIRWALMESHYSTDRSWGDDLLKESEAWIVRLRRALSMIESAPTDLVIEEIIAAQSQNLNTERSLTAIKNWIESSENGSQGGSPGELSRAIDTLLGLAL